MSIDALATLATLVSIIVMLQGLRAWIRDARKSRLLKPQIFELPLIPQNDAIYESSDRQLDFYLVGRRHQIEGLTSRVRNRSLVFVHGASGIGKSTLLKLGVARQLMLTGTWLPVYVDVWGTDWEHGPKQALSDSLEVALEQGLGYDLRKEFGLFQPITPANLFELLRCLQSVCGKRPVIFLIR